MNKNIVNNTADKVTKFLILIIVVLSLVLFMALCTWFFPEYGQTIGSMFAAIVVTIVARYLLGK